MKLHKYRSYRQYVRIQSKKNKKKLDTLWATHNGIDAVASYVKEHVPGAKSGICHGAKHGWEVQELKKSLGFPVLGTDISKTAKRFEDVMQWDFHEVKEEWRGAIDFIYSNSFDHTYDPELCLDRWMECLRPNGCCFIEWSPLHDEDFATEADPFGASEAEYRELFTRKYDVAAVLDVTPGDGDQYPVARKIFVVVHRSRE